MLKITFHDVTGQPCLELEGRLAGAWVCELEHCWHTAKASHPNRTLSVDLTGVTFIDQAGRYLLQWMHRDGVRSGCRAPTTAAASRGSITAARVWSMPPWPRHLWLSRRVRCPRSGMLTTTSLDASWPAPGPIVGDLA
jgi:hypothetical protein